MEMNFKAMPQGGLIHLLRVHTNANTYIFSDFYWRKLGIKVALKEEPAQGRNMLSMPP
jgi:hypothetical protein